MSGSLCGLYGYTPDLSFLQGLDVPQRADCLAALGTNVVFGGYDDPALAAALRERGVRVMAEFGCFVGQEWWQRYPDSRPLLADGMPLPPDDWYYGVNPAHPGVRDTLLARLRELMARQPLDGLWLDFIRWPCHWESPAPPLPQTSFDAATVAAFGRDHGLPPFSGGARAAQALLGEHREAWWAWRCRQITGFAAEAAAIVRAAQPDCLVGAFTVPWRRSDHDGALTRVVGQDLDALAEHVDVFSPMVYHRMVGQDPAWIAGVCEDVRATGKAVWPIIQSVDDPQGLTPDEYRAALEVALSAGDGALVYSLQGLEDEARREATVELFGQ